MFDFKFGKLFIKPFWESKDNTEKKREVPLKQFKLDDSKLTQPKISDIFKPFKKNN